MLERGLLDFGDQVSLATRLLRERPAVAGRAHGAVPVRARGRGPGHRPGTAGAAPAADTASGADARGRRRPGDLYLPGRRGPAPAGAERRTGHAAASSCAPAIARMRPSWPPHSGSSGTTTRTGSRSRHGLDKQLRARRRPRHPAPVREMAFQTAAEEADAVAAEIATRIAAGERAADIAVLVRTNADAGPVLRSLDLQGVPWRTAAGSRLAASPEVRELLSFLRVVADPESSTDLYAVATGAPYGLGGEDLTAILGMASRRHRSLWAVIRELLEQPGLLRLSAADPDRPGATGVGYPGGHRVVACRTGRATCCMATFDAVAATPAWSRRRSGVMTRHSDGWRGCSRPSRPAPHCSTTRDCCRSCHTCGPSSMPARRRTWTTRDLDIGMPCRCSPCTRPRASSSGWCSCWVSWRDASRCATVRSGSRCRRRCGVTPSPRRRPGRRSGACASWP